ncbi:MAG: DNA-protecting protein DprA [Candidatus Colwellbacteria bacterium]|nr:DNA-protecting protein DprA [Candidatus Colwellbacteria bacterium]
MEFKTINFGDANYPALLREIPNPPKQIYVRGTLPDQQLPLIAIVGTRKATVAGLGIAEETAGKLARQGLIIVSGLAMGIDTAAHRGALGAGGKTVAVLGNGVDEIYPAQNENLAKEILETGGAIVSEYPPGEPSFRGNFIQRNRIISGLSVAVVIVEAPMRSGALSTAGFAAEQGRSVFIIPGPVTHPNYVGSHGLIRDGAILATGANNILEDLGLLQEARLSPETAKALTGRQDSGGQAGIRELPFQAELTNQESLIFEAIKTAGEPIHVDRITSIAKLEAQVVNVVLTTLILKGLVKEVDGKYQV